MQERSFIGGKWLIASVLALLACASPAFALSALSVDIDPAADCNSRADLVLSWSGAGLHDEFGVATDRSGSNIGTFGPSSSANNDYSGGYQVPISTAQPAGSVIGSYAWVGSNPPTPATAIEFFVLYNCTTRAVLVRCLGAYGTCPKTALAALATLPRPAIPASSTQTLIVLVVLMTAIGGGFLRRRRTARAGFLR
ncbi:MAG: hypothetical protein M3Z31_08530 [Pseudomonadota bacterium]|nr:hypothetical protein [Pseudomonadota bacterium]